MASTEPWSTREYADERDPQQFWQEAAPSAEPIKRRWFLPAILVLVALSVPWYLPPRLVEPVVGGLPVWTWLALGFSGALAVLTAWAALRLWRDEEAE